MTGDARRRKVLDEVNLRGEEFRLRRERDGIRRALGEALQVRSPLDRRLAVAPLVERYNHVERARQTVVAQLDAVRRELAGS